ncbi:3013_t:CDS:2 [Dentiscutata erythropus]|uniref:3013_t:CDS:1 n=1 Tax=Dentiscutata erythropus TaxID=1348616 RepID=A0A9N9J0V0_9GLOM|nr:3013_t:CDS:2 [Dentiscutata erythropus]
MCNKEISTKVSPGLLNDYNPFIEFYVNNKEISTEVSPGLPDNYNPFIEFHVNNIQRPVLPTSRREQHSQRRQRHDSREINLDINQKYDDTKWEYIFLHSVNYIDKWYPYMNESKSNFS